MVKTRIAPSPTGKLHIGTARSALFNYLFAKQQGGIFILRIEDTDRARSKKEFEDDIIQGLTWLGLAWDEFYRQSERLRHYTSYLERLLNQGKAFYCPHKAEDTEGTAHICSKREPATYSLQSTVSSIIRFKIPLDSEITFNDIVRGKMRFLTNEIGDFSIAKSTHEPLFNFAVVIDDYEMKITHVIRGEDHLSNTPKHIVLQEALGFPNLEYAHIPLVLGSDRSKLSKRHGASSLSEFKNEGYLAEAMINMMAFLGWNPGDEREFFMIEDLVKEFSFSRVKKSGAIFNPDRLTYLNQHYLRTLPLEVIAKRAKEFFVREYGTNRVENFKNLKEAIALERARAATLVELATSLDFIFHLSDYDPSLLIWKNQSNEEVVAQLNKSLHLVEATPEGEYDVVHLQERFFNEAQKAGDRGALLWPLRVALSGKRSSPGPHEIAAVLGKAETLKRIRYATKRINN